MDRKKLISELTNNRLQWNKVNDQPCIHTFYKDYYINLCLWSPMGVDTISIDADNIKNGSDNVVDLNIKIGDEEYQNLLNLYNNAWSSATNISNVKLASY